jgi:predicted ester cyclase
MPSDDLERNKAVVLRFNREVIEGGSEAALLELVAPDFVNRTATPGTAPGIDGLRHMLFRVLRPAFPDLRVEIQEQVAERDLVTTRKSLHGTHSGELMGIAPTGRSVEVKVIDIVRVRAGRYVEHWSVTSLPTVLAELRAG